MKRKIPYSLAFAIVLLLALGALAAAAGFGVFGSLSDNTNSFVNGARLERLDEAAQTLDDSAALAAPSAAPEAAATLYDELLARQSARMFDLTLNQAYCDGRKLYYAYTLKTNLHEITFSEDAPEGLGDWYMEYPGETLKDVLQHSTQETHPELAAQLDNAALRCVIRDSVALGDGASITDGSEKGIDTMILDSGEKWIDPYTLTGFQEVELPENYEPGESIDILLPVMYSTTLYLQDETGVHAANIRQSENRGVLRVPFTVEVNGGVQPLSGTLQTDEYTAHASLSVSDVTIYGEVVFDAPEWAAAYAAETEFYMNGGEGETPAMPEMIHSYQLVADGEVIRNIGGGYGLDEEGKFYVMLEFDLPDSMDSLALKPEEEKRSDEVIVIR